MLADSDAESTQPPGELSPGPALPLADRYPDITRGDDGRPRLVKYQARSPAHFQVDANLYRTLLPGHQVARNGEVFWEGSTEDRNLRLSNCRIRGVLPLDKQYVHDVDSLEKISGAVRHEAKKTGDECYLLIEFDDLGDFNGTPDDDRRL